MTKRRKKQCLLSSVQSLSRVQLFATPWRAACQAFLSINSSRSLLKLISIELVMPSNHLILCHPLPLLPSIVPNIRVFSNESVLCIRWPKYWSFSFSINTSNEIQDWFPFGWTGWISLQSKGLSRVFSNTTVQKHQLFGTQKNHSFDYMDLCWQSNVLSRFVTAFLPRSKHLLISWLQSPSAVILEPMK